MDRKLNHSLIAMCAAGLALVLGLLAAHPADRAGGAAAEPPGAATAAADDAAESGLRAPRTAKGGRRGLALPYFSIAHGLRRIGG